MSAGHEHSDWVSADTGKLKRVMENPAIQQYRWNRCLKENKDHDLPYLAGYSKDGDTIYFDRHLPDTIELMDDGRKWIFDPREFVRIHEQIEKALIDVLGWKYGPAHAVANAAERRAVLEHGIPWLAYNEALEPYIKADEMERLKSVPAELDMTPYLFPPVNYTLIKRMQAAMGKQKLEKTDPKVDYADDAGKPSEHCGPDERWPKGWCSMYVGDNECSAVAGYIAPHGYCRLWKRAKGA